MSATAISVANFDYSEFEKDDKGKLISLAGQIKKARDTYDDSLFDLGEVIAHAHSVLTKHGSGSFVKWIELETGIENTTAYNYMYAWMRFHGFPNRNMITAGAMYKLSAPKAPPAAAKEAEKLANKGERVTESVASELVKKHKPEKVTEKVYSSVGKTEHVADKQVTKTEPAKTAAASVAPSPDPKGNCPRGGDHVADDEGDCQKCKEPNVGPKKPDPAPSFETSKMKPPKNGTPKPGFNDKAIDEAFRVLSCGLDDLYGKIETHYENRYDLLGGNKNAYAKAKATLAGSLRRSHDAVNDSLKAFGAWRDA